MRYAIITGPTVETVRKYLPANYIARQVGVSDGRVMILGEDRAGWTLDGYVIPRLASGLHFAREIDTTERDVILEEARVADEMEYASVRGIIAPDF